MVQGCAFVTFPCGWGAHTRDPRMVLPSPSLQSVGAASLLTGISDLFGSQDAGLALCGCRPAHSEEGLWSPQSRVLEEAPTPHSQKLTIPRGMQTDGRLLLWGLSPGREPACTRPALRLGWRVEETRSWG